MIRRGRRAPIPILVALALGLVAAVPAHATFHLVVVREVYAGSVASPASEYVELQAFAAGQNFVGHEGIVLHLYGPDGTETAKARFSADLPNGANQMTMVLATPLAAAEFGITPDAELPAAGSLSSAGGKVCWVNLDCVSWGSFLGSSSAPSPSGNPVAAGGIPDTMAIRRTIEPNCSTLLEPADDRSDSARDFFLAAPNPRPNAVAPSERACAAPPASNGRLPQTRLTQRPPKRSFDATPTFRFSSTEEDSTFQCRLDRGRFRPCRSPFTAKRLKPGAHTFAVRARDGEGDLDATPASYGFQIARARR